MCIFIYINPSLQIDKEKIECDFIELHPVDPIVDLTEQISAIKIRNIPEEAKQKAYERAASLTVSIMAEVTAMKTTVENKNTIIHLLKKMVSEMEHLNTKLMKNSVHESPGQIVASAAVFIHDHLSMYDSARKRDKQCQENDKYVSSKRTAVGTHWVMKPLKDSNISIPKLVQSTMEYIPIVETIVSIFKDDEYRRAYFQHNQNHTCSPGQYEFFCCGKVYKDNEFFQNNPSAIQVQLATDDFEVADPLGAQATVYKMTAVYMRILNIPRKYQSKLHNIRLVCLCLTEDLKTKETDFNNIWDMVVKDLRELENYGVDIGEQKRLKGSLVLLSFDNLGGNICLGLAESFNTHYYCRICECSKEQCRLLTKEVIAEYRTKEKYERQLRIIKDCEKVDFKLTKSIKRYCSLNDLSQFHIFVNKTVDIMHDILEGAIPITLKQLFHYGISNNIFTLKEIQDGVKFYSFGFLQRSNIPSLVQLHKSNLGLSSSQIKCLFLNIPFILSKYRDHEKINHVWICIETLLRIIEIVFSHQITEEDVERLENDITVHLSNLKRLGLESLVPKQHILLHYPYVIRSMGPLSDMCMIRFEAKHKYFKQLAKVNNNFINLPKTLSKRHQEDMLHAKSIVHEQLDSTKTTLMKQNDFVEFKSIFPEQCCNMNHMYETKTLHLNTIKYRKGMYVIFEYDVYEIKKIVIINEVYFFWCIKMAIDSFDTYSNCLKIRHIISSQINRIIGLNDLTHKRSYESMSIDGDLFLIPNDLFLRNISKYNASTHS